MISVRIGDRPRVSRFARNGAGADFWAIKAAHGDKTCLFPHTLTCSNEHTDSLPNLQKERNACPTELRTAKSGHCTSIPSA